MVTIMAVEDDELILSVYGAIIGKLGYRAELCTTATEAWRKLSEGFHPDLIITDLSMPGMDGEELIIRLTDHPVLRDVPVIVASGHLDPENDSRLRACGAKKLLSKPVLMKDIIAAIEESLHSQ